MKNHVAEDRAALAHKGNGHERVEEVVADGRIGEQGGLHGTKHVVQTRDDNELLNAGKDHVAEQVDVLGKPQQAIGEAVGEGEAGTAVLE